MVSGGHHFTFCIRALELKVTPLGYSFKVVVPDQEKGFVFSRNSATSVRELKLQLIPIQVNGAELQYQTQLTDRSGAVSGP